MTIELFLYSRDVPEPEPAFLRRKVRLQSMNLHLGCTGAGTNAQKIGHLGYPLCTEQMPPSGMIAKKMARRSVERRAI
jgi:hypothetical protein